MQEDLDPVRILADVAMRQLAQTRRWFGRWRFVGASVNAIFCPAANRYVPFGVDVKSARLGLGRIIPDQRQDCVVGVNTECGELDVRSDA